MKKTPSWGKDIKCPKCQGPGKSILDDRRLMFQCLGICQYRDLLKLINLKGRETKQTNVVQINK